MFYYIYKLCIDTILYIRVSRLIRKYAVKTITL